MLKRLLGIAQAMADDVDAHMAEHIDDACKRYRGYSADDLIGKFERETHGMTKYQIWLALKHGHGVIITRDQHDFL